MLLAIGERGSCTTMSKKMLVSLLVISQGLYQYFYLEKPESYKNIKSSTINIHIPFPMTFILSHLYSQSLSFPYIYIYIHSYIHTHTNIYKYTISAIPFKSKLHISRHKASKFISWYLLRTKIFF